MQTNNIFAKLNNNDYFTFIIKIIDYCNYSCYYCCEDCNLHSKHNIIDLDKVQQYIENIITCNFLANKKIKISLYGGEPMLHPCIIDFCYKLRAFKKDIYIEIYSNFSVELSAYKKLLACNVNFILTYHRENKDFIDKFKSIDNEELYKHIVLNVMAENKYSDYLDAYTTLVSFISENKIQLMIPVVLKLVKSTQYFDASYSNNELARLKRITSNVNFSKQYKYNSDFYTDQDVEFIDFNFKHCICNAGYTSQYIDVNGNIYSCVSKLEYEKQILKKQSRGNIYNISQINIDTLFKQTLCNSNSCTDFDSCKYKVFNKNVNQ